MQPPTNSLKAPFTATKRIKLLQVSAEPIAKLGGVGLFVMHLARGLPPSYQVDLACPDAKRDSLPHQLRDRIGELFLTPEGHWSAAEKREFVRSIRGRHYDLIHFHGTILSFDAYLPWRSPLHPLANAGIPWIYTNHCVPSLTTGLYRENYPLPGKMLKAALAYCSVGYLMTVCPQPLFVSRENQDRVAKYFPWTRRKLKIIYPSSLEGEPPKCEVRDPAITIGTLGHIAWRKGQFDLLQAFCLLLPKFPHLKLILVGHHADDGDCASRIKGEIAARNLQESVMMPGGIGDLRPFWEQVDIYVQPSHYEGAPVALMEAVWHGKPSVGTRVSGIPEIIEDGVNGLLVESKNPGALATAIERLISDLELRRRFAVAGPSHILARGMTRPQVIRRHLDLYGALMARRA